MTNIIYIDHNHTHENMGNLVIITIISLLIEFTLPMETYTE